MTVTEIRQLDPDPLPARPLPHELAVVPATQLAETASTFASTAHRTTYADGTTIPADARATHALYGLAAATVALEELARQVAVLATVARAAGASAEEIRARVSETAGVAASMVGAVAVPADRLRNAVIVEETG